MKNVLYAGAATLALTAGAALGEQVTVFGPWLGPDQENAEALLLGEGFLEIRENMFLVFPS